VLSPRRDSSDAIEELIKLNLLSLQSYADAMVPTASVIA
jgi:hypothetical protein